MGPGPKTVEMEGPSWKGLREVTFTVGAGDGDGGTVGVGLVGVAYELVKAC